jgi:hypothetical protein
MATQTASAFKATVVKEALNTVNSLRVSLGLDELGKLPKGWKRDAQDCPIFRALNGDHATEVSGAYIEFADEEDANRVRKALGEEPAVGDSVPTPPELRAFIEHFDDGAFPEYEEG